MRPQLRTRWAVLFALALVALLAVAPGPHARAQSTEPVYFSQTGHFVQGTFRVFYEQYGGIPQFGYPITDEYFRNGDSRIVQYFERARFELVETPDRPTSVLLANVGSEYVRLKGYNFPPVPAVADTANRRYFPETGHTLESPFKEYWERANGPVYFGAPISERVAEVFPNGIQKTVQYFERTRIELEPGGQRFSLGLIAYDLAPCQQKLPRPQNLPPSGPGLEGDPETCKDPSSMVMGRIYPAINLPGGQLGIEAINFVRNEQVSMWINMPDKSVRPIPYLGLADGTGRLVTGFVTRPDDPLGFYTVVVQGIRSERQVVLPFRLAR